MATQSEQRIQTVCLIALTTVVVAAALYWLAPVMVPFVLAVFIAMGLAPCIELPVRLLRVPRAVALATTLALAIVMLTLLASLVTSSLGQLTARRDTYQQQVRALIDRAVDVLPAEILGIDTEQGFDPLAKIPSGAVGRVLLSTTNALLDLLSKSFLVLIFVIFLLLGGSGGALPDGVWRDITWQVQRYLATKALLSMATGVLVGGTLALLGVDLAMAFGLFAFLLNFIPSIGSIIATLLPLPVVLLSPEVSPLVAVLAILIPGIIQVTIGNGIEPKVMGDALDLHPVTILLALIFWGMLWGIPGMLLATPITAVMKILLSRLEYTRGLADLLAGRINTLSRAPAVD